jgi:hypothetical protein
MVAAAVLKPKYFKKSLLGVFPKVNPSLDNSSIVSKSYLNSFSAESLNASV